MTDTLPVLDGRLFRAEQVRKLDTLAIEQQPVAGIELMRRAGKAAWDVLSESWPQAARIVVVCGAGNNAGDGYVVAAHAASAGRQITVIALQAPEFLKGDAFIVARQYLDAGGTVKPFMPDLLTHADVIVDAILGIGLDRVVDDTFLTVINTINAAGKPVLAIDVPSGLNADTGKAMGAAVRADVTLSFIARKQGLYTGDATVFCGSLKFADLGVSPRILDQVSPSADLLQLQSTTALLRKRPRNAHKGHFGHLLVVGGDHGYAGSVRLCAESAARSGAGLVTVATRAEHITVVAAARPELMASGIDAVAALQPLLERATVIAIGPGLGQSEWSGRLLARILDTYHLPLVVDADALNLLALEPVRRENWVLTPHPGEAARLLGTRVAEVEANRFAAATALQANYGGVIVLKGSGTVIVDQGGRISVCPAGNPGMASGGMGDVLAGVIAALVCQQLDLGDAARTGVYVHASAADRVAAADGERGMLATDLLPSVRKLLNP